MTFINTDAAKETCHSVPEIEKRVAPDLSAGKGTISAVILMQQELSLSLDITLCAASSLPLLPLHPPKPNESPSVTRKKNALWQKSCNIGNTCFPGGPAM